MRLPIVSQQFDSAIELLLTDKDGNETSTIECGGVYDVFCNGEHLSKFADGNAYVIRSGCLEFYVSIPETVSIQDEETKSTFEDKWFSESNGKFYVSDSTPGQKQIFMVSTVYNRRSHVWCNIVMAHILSLMPKINEYMYV